MEFWKTLWEKLFSSVLPTVSFAQKHNFSQQLNEPPNNTFFFRIIYILHANYSSWNTLKFVNN